DINAALKISPTIPALTTAKASLLIEMNRNAQAMKVLSTFIAVNKDYVPAHYLRGKLYTIEANWPQAYSEFSACIGDKKAMTPAAAEMRGKVLMHMKKYDEAASDFSQCLNFITTYFKDTNWVHRLLAERAQAYKLAGKTALAE